MSIYFPEYSDLGKTSSAMQSSWEAQYSIREKYRKYYEGDIFKATQPDEVGIDETDINLYPVGLNIVKWICTAQADALFGEWDEEIIRFGPQQDAKVEQPEKDAASLVSRILASSQANETLWELALDREVYGGGAIKITPAPQVPGHIRWSKVPLDGFYPIWNPDDQDHLLEAYVVVRMTRDQAKARYGYLGDKDEVTRIEHWTESAYENTLDGVRMDAYSGRNPWGFVPFEYFPRVRSRYWWGDAMTEDLIKVQDELNMRIADLGEAINFNTHPPLWGYNLPKTFKSSNYPIGPGVMWDMGRVLGSSPEPKVGALELNNPIPGGTFDFIKFLYDWTQISSFTPPVALGRDEGGGQRSGITLEIRMLPLIRSVRRSRAYMSDGLVRSMRKSAKILQQKDFSDISRRALDRLINGDLIPHYAPIMPRDQAQLVDEVNKRMSTTPPSISLETAVKKLGQGTSEVERILEMLDNDDLYQRAQMGMFGDPSGMDSAAGNAP